MDLNVEVIANLPVRRFVAKARSLKQFKARPPLVQVEATFCVESNQLNRYAHRISNSAKNQAGWELQPHIARILSPAHKEKSEVLI